MSKIANRIFLNHRKEVRGKGINLKAVEAAELWLGILVRKVDRLQIFAEKRNGDIKKPFPFQIETTKRLPVSGRRFCFWVVVLFLSLISLISIDNRSDYVDEMEEVDGSGVVLPDGCCSRSISARSVVPSFRFLVSSARHAEPFPRSK